jgi:perosamine synthetase
MKECLDTNWVSSAGPFVDRFERMVAEYVGSKYAVAAVNGTAALHIALLVSGVQPNDEVLLPSLSFIAPANAIRYVGAWPVFMDSESKYWQMDPQKMTDFLQRECCWTNGRLRNKVSGRQIRAILPVHVLGHPVAMDPIVEVARKYKLAVVEDATESLGARYKGGMVGRLGDLGCFSFNGNKIITAGGGGMIVTDNESWARRAKYLITQAKDDAVESIHVEIGYNYRLTNIQAAMGCAQLELLDEYIQAKRTIAASYARALANVPGITPMSEADWAFSIFWIFTALVDVTRYGLDSRELMGQLGRAGVQTRPLWQPLHRSPAQAGAQSYLCEVADRLNKEALSLPSSVGLRSESQNKVIELIRQCRKPALGQN